MPRLRCGLAACLLLLLAGLDPALAQSYPNQPIRLLVPNAAGGLTDIIARVVGERLGKRLGQPVVVVNQPGADTVVGVTAVTQAKPDGYTLLMAELGRLQHRAADPRRHLRQQVRSHTRLAHL